MQVLVPTRNDGSLIFQTSDLLYRPICLHVAILHCLPQYISHLRIEFLIFLFPHLPIWKYHFAQSIDSWNQCLVVWCEVPLRRLYKISFVSHFTLFNLGQLLCISIVPPFVIRDHSALPSRPSVIYANPEKNLKERFQVVYKESFLAV